VTTSVSVIAGKTPSKEACRYDPVRGTEVFRPILDQEKPFGNNLYSPFGKTIILGGPQPPTQRL
jgi:hypothetical protein